LLLPDDFCSEKVIEKMLKKREIQIGTSGWNYKHWKGDFYPEDLPQKEWLGYYLKKFTTVEINNSFYQLPDKKTLQKWFDKVPADFRFSIKASRYITHMKKLKEPGESLTRFIERIKPLKNKLGPVLFQLPPRWRFNKDRLEAFLKKLPEDFRYVMEFRDESWWNDECFSLLEEFRVAFCIFDLAGTLTPKTVTTDFVYIRLHGPDGAYKGQYDAGTLSGWAGALHTWTDQGKSVYCYFDNDDKGYAARDALKLQDMLS
jgi:uncharacterized protein YecE (DUF72 family)